jgi:hypothetical protein
MYVLVVAVLIGDFMVSRMDLPYAYNDIQSCQDVALVMESRTGIADTVSAKYRMTANCVFVEIQPKPEEEVKSIFDGVESFFE